MDFLKVILYSLLVSILVAGLLSPSAGAAGLKAEPDQLRAVFTQRFVKYVNWPEPLQAKLAKRPVIVAATDAEAFEPYFTSPSIQLRQWPRVDLENCLVFVIMNTDERTTAALLKRVRGLPILTIGQSPDFVRMGGIINFVPKGGKLRLQINIDAAQRAGLTISSRLLKLADIYRENPGELP